MAKRVKRWRVSDVFSAIRRSSGDQVAGYVARWARMDAGHILNDSNVGAWLGLPQAGRSLGIAWSDWVQMSDAQRVDAVVATARRLNVPRRA